MGHGIALTRMSSENMKPTMCNMGQFSSILSGKPVNLFLLYLKASFSRSKASSCLYMEELKLIDREFI